jgi:enoyl-CoA hydratase
VVLSMEPADPRGPQANETRMIDLKTDNGIAIVTVTHGKANALDLELNDALAKCFAQIAESASRAVVVTAQGRIFCAGVDLIRLSSGGPDYVRQFIPALHRAFNALLFFPKPVVAAINGHAIAGGCVLACAADRRIMARGNGRIGVTELLVGVPFPAVAFETMRLAVPKKYLPELLYTGATLDVDAALERGLVDAVVPPDELMPRTIAAAEQLASLSPAAFAQTKAQLRAEAHERIERTGAATDKIATDIWAAESTLRYIRDYVAQTLKKA